MLPLPIIEDEPSHVTPNVLDCEEVFGESSPTILRVMPAMEYDGHQIFKATLISLLNADLLLSKDMLLEVKNSNYSNNNDGCINASSCSLPCWLDEDMM